MPPSPPTRGGALAGPTRRGEAYRQVRPYPLDVLVVCVGGGGIPVVVDRDGRLRGVEAVIDKDRAAALLAHGMHADALLLLTDVPGVERAHGTPEAVPIRQATADEMLALDLPAGSMGPKVEAARPSWPAPSRSEVGGLDQVA